MSSNTYYFLRQNLFTASNIIEIDGHNEETAKIKWLNGSKLSSSFPHQTLMLDPSYGSNFPDFFDTTVPVMSSRLLNKLKMLGVVNIDSYPVDLKNMDTGELNQDYHIVNIMGRIDAVDYEQSTFKKIGPVYRFKSITIDENVIRNYDGNLFRLAKGPGFIVVDEYIAKALGEDFVALMLQDTKVYDGV